MKQFYYLCLRRDLTEGKYRCFSVSDGLVATMKNAKPLVGINKCAHRGFKVTNEEEGSLPIKCPYHGRQFNFDKLVPSTSVGEFVFAIKEPISLSSKVSMISCNLGEQFGSYTQTVKAPFYLWMQNTADPNHLKFVHKDGFTDLFDGFKPYDVLIEKNQSSYSMKIKSRVVNRYEKIKANVQSDEFFHAIVGPNLSITSFLGIFYSVECVTVLSDNEIEVNTRFFVSKDSNIPNIARRAAFESNIKILQEDKAFMEKWAETHDPNDISEWLPGEERIQAYVKMISDMGLYPEMPRGFM